eukprot:TRINITY_DN33136_c0_g1_i1.p1 TRINITY_DN33136_c0_g1~~TRINITY_DN33136_c0_g1_i1.p1  ORF type:complete len:462 (+),score=156.12 TRINITY_DN33136_c0_g1_i1:63-1388(+)
MAAAGALRKASARRRNAAQRLERERERWRVVVRPSADMPAHTLREVCCSQAGLTRIAAEFGQSGEQVWYVYFAERGSAEAAAAALDGEVVDTVGLTPTPAPSAPPSPPARPEQPRPTVERWIEGEAADRQRPADGGDPPAQPTTVEQWIDGDVASRKRTADGGTEPPVKLPRKLPEAEVAEADAEATLARYTPPPPPPPLPLPVPAHRLSLPEPAPQPPPAPTKTEPPVTCPPKLRPPPGWVQAAAEGPDPDNAVLTLCVGPFGQDVTTSEIRAAFDAVSVRVEGLHLRRYRSHQSHSGASLGDTRQCVAEVRGVKQARHAVKYLANSTFRCRYSTSVPRPPTRSVELWGDGLGWSRVGEREVFMRLGAVPDAAVPVAVEMVETGKRSVALVHFDTVEQAASVKEHLSGRRLCGAALSVRCVPTGEGEGDDDDSDCSSLFT